MKNYIIQARFDNHPIRYTLRADIEPEEVRKFMVKTYPGITIEKISIQR